MIYFLYGSDTFRLRKKVGEIIAEYKKVHKSGLNYTRLEAAASSFLEIKQTIETVSMFDEKRLVHIENLFDSGAAADEFIQYAETARLNVSKEVVVLVVAGGESKKETKNKLEAKLRAIAKTEEFNILRGSRLQKWYKDQIRRKGIRFARDAEEALFSRVGGDLWRLEHELEKLRAYANGEVVTREMVVIFVKPKIDPAIFQTIGAISAKNKREAFERIHGHLEAGESPLYILSMITYQIRNVLLAKDPAFSSLKLHPFVKRKSLAETKKFTAEELKNIYEKLLEADLDIKLGRKDPRLALELFVANL